MNSANHEEAPRFQNNSIPASSLNGKAFFGGRKSDPPPFGGGSARMRKAGALLLSANC